MVLRALLVLLFAAPLMAASTLVDHDPDLIKTRPLLVANQDLTVELSVADIVASRTINAALSPAQIARWRRLGQELAERRPAGSQERPRTIFEFTRELDLSPLQVTSMKHQIATIHTLQEETRRKIGANHAEIRKLHPELGLTELAALPRPAILIERTKDLGLSASQMARIKPVVARLGATTEECRRRLVANAAALRPLMDNEAALDRLRPFVRSNAEVLTELTIAGLRASLILHEHLNPKQRRKWHELELPRPLDAPAPPSYTY